MTAIESEPARRKAAHSIPEVCAYTGLGRDSVYAAIRTGRLIARKYGRRTVVLDDDMRAFLEALPRLGPA
jgi:excisionase family DNA binding protein